MFVVCRTVFIDVLSFKHYVDGEVWAGAPAMLRGSFNPLLLRSLFAVAHNELVSRPAGRHSNLRHCGPAALVAQSVANVLRPCHVQARLQRAASARDGNTGERAKSAKLPKRSFIAMLEQLRHWDGGLEPCRSTATTWQHYAEKQDLCGCRNAAQSGASSRRSAKCEATHVVGTSDATPEGTYSEGGLERRRQTCGRDSISTRERSSGRRREPRQSRSTSCRSTRTGAKSQPDQGWMGRERRSANSGAGGADALIALPSSIILAIGRNVPRDQLVAWSFSLAQRGHLIEFVQKSDPTDSASFPGAAGRHI